MVTRETSPQHLATACTVSMINLNVELRYAGTLMIPQNRPNPTDLLSDETGVTQRAGFLIRNYVDRIRSERTDSDVGFIFISSIESYTTALLHYVRDSVAIFHLRQGIV